MFRNVHLVISTYLNNFCLEKCNNFNIGECMQTFSQMSSYHPLSSSSPSSSSNGALSSNGNPILISVRKLIAEKMLPTQRVVSIFQIQILKPVFPRNESSRKTNNHAIVCLLRKAPFTSLDYENINWMQFTQYTHTFTHAQTLTHTYARLRVCVCVYLKACIWFRTLPFGGCARAREFNNTLFRYCTSGNEFNY